MSRGEAFRQAFLSSSKAQCAGRAMTAAQAHNAIGRSVMTLVADDWQASAQAGARTKRACYLSAEFLVGRAVFNNLLCLGLTGEADALLKESGLSLAALEEIEDAALGNGGLGRLAACYLDSAATLNLPLTGYGIRYRYGLFKQSFAQGRQREEPDDWTRLGDPWSVRRDEDAVTVRYADQTVRAVPYDMPILGCNTRYIGTLRLWQAEPLAGFDFALFNAQRYDDAVREQNRAEDISRTLYPNDDTDKGRLLRLRQEYFFASAAIADLLREYKLLRGDDLTGFADFCAIQLNDTHPVIAIPELILRLTEEGLGFDEAFEIAQSVFHYTNHTIMAEALEKWGASLVRRLLPRVYEIIRLIAARQKRELRGKQVPAPVFDEKLALLHQRTVHMARLALYTAAHTNGVAELHTGILTGRELSDWYALYPKRFLNITNGITPRRWLALCNPDLSALITGLLGGDRWVTSLSELKKLERYANDADVLNRFMETKRENKRKLCAYIKTHEGITLDPDSIFDTQIKRLHEYKRQLLNAFAILDTYFGLLEGRITDYYPTTFLFGAKSAPGYFRAKGIIQYINEVARLVNNDARMEGRLKVVFVQNYNVSYAERLVAAADFSEQISTAGTEASGTGNMKFMLNGTVTLGTYDGANVEIVREAGEENSIIFGLRVEDVERIKPTYDPAALYEGNPRMKRVVDSLVDGTFDDGGTGCFLELYTALLKGASWHEPDHYFLLADFEAYLAARQRANALYRDRAAFAKMCWMNLCSAGWFSSDRSVEQYAREIWGISPVAL